MINRHMVILKTASCFLLILIYFFAHSFLFSENITSQRLSGKSLSKWSFSPYIVMTIAGEFKGLTADWLAMEAGARMANKNIPLQEKDWDTIIRIFNLSMDLDPYFQQTYFLAQGSLPWDAHKVKETNSILKIAGQKRTWDWIPKYFMGFNSYYFLGNNAEAAKLLIEAGTVPNAPAFLPILGARLAHKGGTTEAAIPLLQSMLNKKDPTEPGYQDIKDRLAALQGVYVIEQAVKAYKQHYGREPKHLSSLLSSGILSQIPHNPYDVDYCFDKEGKVYFDNPKCQ